MSSIVLLEMDKVKRVTTSIKIDPNMWKKAKIEAIKEDIDLSELVEKAIERYMGNKK